MDCFVNKAAFMKVLKAWSEVWRGYFRETASTHPGSGFSAWEKKGARERTGWLACFTSLTAKPAHVKRSWNLFKKSSGWLLYVHFVCSIWQRSYSLGENVTPDPVGFLERWCFYLYQSKITKKRNICGISVVSPRLQWDLNVKQTCLRTNIVVKYSRSPHLCFDSPK